MIEKRKLASFPGELSAVCLGAARLGGDYDEKRSFELLDAYYGMGGRFIDTANVYGRWSGRNLNESERVIGKWMKLRQITDLVVTTKGCHYAPDAPEVSRVNRECAAQDIEESRAALGLDVIPIYLTHRDDPSRDVRYIVDFLAELVSQGKVTRFGFSNYAAERVQSALDYLGKDWREVFVGVSNEWSLHEECRAAENGGSLRAPNGMICTGRELWNLHREKELPLIPFSAAAHGFYDKVNPNELSEKERAVYGDVKKRGEENGLSATAVSVAYLLNSGVTAIPVVSVSRLSQMEEFEKISAFRADLSALSPFRRMEEQGKAE